MVWYLRLFRLPGSRKRCSRAESDPVDHLFAFSPSVGPPRVKTADERIPESALDYGQATIPSCDVMVCEGLYVTTHAVPDVTVNVTDWF